MTNNNITHRSCTTCLQWLPLTDFNRSTGKKFNRSSRCRDCEKKRTKLYRQNRNRTISPKQKERFFQTVTKTDTCWLWSGYTMINGYGQSSLNGCNMLAHRFSYLLHFGECPPDLMVCHTCDNRLCVNPEHLFLGTASDNLQDMAHKGRRKGIKHAMVKLTETDVIAIRLSPLPAKELAKQYPVSQNYISQIRAYRYWTHI